ncbi:hypothetical protein KBD34_05205 [Patescibacteria group bacterium]|nr:hypothetical protein [Patescibacteria group bacterium]
MAKQEPLQHRQEYYADLISGLLVELKESIKNAEGGEVVKFWMTASDDIFAAMKDLTVDDLNGMCQYMPGEAAQSVTTLLPSMPANTPTNQEARLRGFVARLLAVLVYASLQTEGESKATELGFRVPDDLMGASTELAMAVPPHNAAANDAPAAVESNVYVADNAGTPDATSADPPHAAETAPVASPPPPAGAVSLHRREGNAQPLAAAPQQWSGDRASWEPNQGPVTRTVNALDNLHPEATRWQKVRASWPMIKEGLRFIGIMLACFIAVGIIFWIVIKVR